MCIRDRQVHTVPDDYPTIQAAIDAANPGDTVFVRSGRYVENLVISRELRLEGEDRAAVWIEPPSWEAPAILTVLIAGEAWIGQITIRSAETAIEAVLGARAGATVEQVLIAECETGIFAEGPGSLTVRDSVFSENFGAVYALSGRSDLAGLEINRGVGGIIVGPGSTSISHCVIGFCKYAIITYTAGCGFLGGPVVPTRTIGGVANRLFALNIDVCLGSQGAPWPPEFIDTHWRRVADSAVQLYNSGVMAEQSQNYRVAEGAYREALGTLKTEDASFPLLEAYIRGRLGRVYVEQGQYELALDHLRAARLLYFARGLVLDVASIDSAIGFAYRHLGLFDDAIAQHRAAQATYLARGMVAEAAGTDTNIALVLSDRGQYEEALRLYERARVVFVAERDAVGLAHLDLNMGLAYFGLGQYNEALAKYEAARPVLVAAGLTASLAILDQNLGNVLSLLGRYEEAIARYRSALQAYRSLDMEVDAAVVEVNIGVIDIDLGRYELAVQRLAAARVVLRRHGLHVRVAMADCNLGVAYLQIGRLLDAVAAFRAARSVYAEEGLLLSRAEVDHNLGAVYHRLGLHNDALARFRDAFAVYEAEQNWVRAAQVQTNIGLALGNLGYPDESVAAHTAALALLDAVPPVPGMRYSYPNARWVVHYNIAQLQEREQRYREAVVSLDQALEVIESMRAYFEAEDIKQAWGEQTRHVYERLIDLLHRMGQGAQAFPYAERSRARTFLDLLAQGPVGTLENIADEGIRSGVVEAAVIEADLWEVVGDLPEDTAVLEYFTTDKAVYLWVITRGQVGDPIRIEVDRAVLLAQVLAFREAIETPITHENEAAVLRAVLEQARDLYDLLLSPVAEEIAGYAHLVVIPSGPLHYLPFAALYDCPGCEPGAMLSGDVGEHLVQRFTLSYLPSLTTLKYAERQGRAATPEPTFLGLADPDAQDPRFTRLPEAQAEVRAIATRFPEDGRTVYVDLQATEEALRAEASRARYVVLSTHGSFNPHNPMHSFLLFAPSGATPETDGKLYTYEVFGLGLRADLVTLSACETLLPSLREAERQVRVVRGADTDATVSLPPELLERITAGDELVGLTRAFIYAGTPTVLSTLWSVYDVPTRDLMVGFYEELQGESEVTKAQALQRAQVLLLTGVDESGRRPYRHPVYWAAFGLVGDWR